MRTALRGLPRFMNRGLIEAGDGPLGRPLSAGLPRFMNRGLIEARSSALPGGNASGTSPIHESGPH